MNTPVAIMVARIKLLPCRHRIAHLSALIRQQPIRSARRERLAAILRDEMMRLRPCEDRAV